MDDLTAMRAALGLADKAAEIGEAPIGALVLRGGEIIGRGYNRRETDKDPLAHAELFAIREAAASIGDWRLSGCTLVVTLEPCPMCAGAIVNSRIDRLVYGAADPKAGAVDTLYDICRDSRLNHRLEVTAGVLAEDCGAVLSSFFAALRGKR